MLFAKLSTVLLGLAALTCAAPHPGSGVERRLTWTPRSLAERNNELSKGKNVEINGGENNNGNNGGKNNDKNKNNNNNNNNDVTIIDTTVVQLNEGRRNQEVELTILVQENIKKNNGKKRAKDNVRKNHYRNKNRNVVCIKYSVSN